MVPVHCKTEEKLIRVLPNIPLSNTLSFLGLNLIHQALLPISLAILDWQ